MANKPPQNVYDLFRGIVEQAERDKFNRFAQGLGEELRRRQEDQGIVRCSGCGQKNRVPKDPPQGRAPICGKCKAVL